MAENCPNECRKLQKDWDALMERSLNAMRVEVKLQLDAHRVEVHEVISEWADSTNATLDKINTTLQQIVTVALNKPTGFTGKDVIFLLGGLGVFMIALIYGLEQLGVIVPKLHTGN